MPLLRKKDRGGGMMDRLTVDYGKKFSPFRYAMKDGSDAEIGYFKNYDAFYSHMLIVQKLGEYEDLEEQGLLLRLPCKVGDTVYCIYERYAKCSEYGQVFEEYSCQGCECLECDSHKELYVQSQKVYGLDWIVSNLKRFGKTVFLTQAEAEQKLKEMESD